MKKVLITGSTGFIARNLSSYLKDNYGHSVTLLSVRGDDWRSVDFSEFDCVVHTAALVHKKEKDHTLDEYISINCDLAFDVAKKAKDEGVKHFVFFSSMSVYRAKQSLFNKNIISSQTTLEPITKYGKSKLKAEERLSELVDSNFIISFIRPPFTYGKGCDGNYKKLRALILKYKFSPKFKNKRSMIYITNLCEFVSVVINNGISGVLIPQNNEYSSTEDLAYLIAKYNNTRIISTSLLNPLIKVASLFIPSLGRAFSTMYYEKELSLMDGYDYCIVPFEESIKETEDKS